MNSITQFQKNQGISDEEMAALISEKLGRDISVKGLDSVKRRKEAPVAWLSALGISPREPGGLRDKQAESETKSPGTVATLVPLPFEPKTAQATIEMIYVMAGKGAAMGTRTPAVADVWELQSKPLAEAWIEWAKTNRTVANGIAMLTAGGPGGQVILLNASLIITTLITVQNANRISPFPPGFDPTKTEEENLRAQTEAQVDERLSNP